MAAASSSSSSHVTRILVPAGPELRCCSCLRVLVPGVDEYVCAEAPEQLAEWSAWLSMLVPHGAAFCKLHCWSAPHNMPHHPRFLHQPYAPASVELPQQNRQRRKRRQPADVTDFRDPDPAAPPPRVRTASHSEVSFALVQQWQVSNLLMRDLWSSIHDARPVVGSPDLLAHGDRADALEAEPLPSPYEHLLRHSVHLRSLTGAPSARELMNLVHLMWPRIGGAPDRWEEALHSWPVHMLGRGKAWKFSESPLVVTVIGLTHLRQDIAYDSMAGLFGLPNRTTASRMTRATVRALVELSVRRDVDGAVRFLDEAELSSTFPHRFRKYRSLHSLRAIADCFPVFVQGTPSHNKLHNLLYDGQQHPGDRWVKVLLIVAPSGYIMDVAGPYAPAGKAADGRILTARIVDSDSCWNFACQGGTWLVDYGFRGVRTPPELTVHMPKKWPTRGPVGRQGTTAELDHNNILCSARWVVEAANERVENWRFFNGRPRPASEILNVRPYCLAVSFLFNRWQQSVMNPNKRSIRV